MESFVRWSFGLFDFISFNGVMKYFASLQIDFSFFTFNINYKVMKSCPSRRQEKRTENDHY